MKTNRPAPTRLNTATDRLGLLQEDVYDMNNLFELSTSG